MLLQNTHGLVGETPWMLDEHGVATAFTAKRDHPCSDFIEDSRMQRDCTAFGCADGRTTETLDRPLSGLEL
jgi:hypothetical protein